ncbi:MAG: hypothetical protein DHS20C15_29790 [Planctomycetota bacterium]|nr:MAG: hypothetical protein DHS20C15_29790 [Planctomycetota bacterium]
MNALVRRSLLVLFLALLTSGCAFHSTARDWNGRLGTEGQAIWYTATTKVTFNLFIVIPFIGDASVPGMINELTHEIEARGGDNLRIVQGTSENYWYGIPGLTIFITPVVSQVHAEWQPHPVSLAEWAARCSPEEAQAYAESQQREADEAGEELRPPPPAD